MFYPCWKPATDIFNAGNRWLVKLEIAGVALADIGLLVRGRQLTVRGRRRDLVLQRGFICHSLEISYSDFERNLEFPAFILPGSISSEFHDGILYIHLDTKEQPLSSEQLP
jgi:HSP20 family protein